MYTSRKLPMRPRIEYRNRVTGGDQKQLAIKYAHHRLGEQKDNRLRETSMVYYPMSYLQRPKDS